MTNRRYNLRNTRDRLIRYYNNSNRYRNLPPNARNILIRNLEQRNRTRRVSQIQRWWRGNEIRSGRRIMPFSGSRRTVARRRLPVRGEEANIRDNRRSPDILVERPPPYNGDVTELPTYDEVMRGDAEEPPEYDHTLERYGGPIPVLRRRLREFLHPTEQVGMDEIIDDEPEYNNRRNSGLMDFERWMERRSNAASRIQRAFRRHRFRRDVREFFDNLFEPEEYDNEINSILVNEREIPFDIYRYKGRIGEIRGNYVLYWNKDKNKIGVKWVSEDYMSHPLPFAPDFSKRKIFFLDVLTPNYILNEFRVDVRNQGRRSIGMFYYTQQDIINKNDKSIQIN